MTVPVKTKERFNQLICEVEIDNVNPWRRKHLHTLMQNYRKAPFFDKYAPFFNDFFQREWSSLNELNQDCIHYLLEQLGIQIKVLPASTLKPEGKKSDLILDICKKVGADTYLSGISGKEYLDESSFQRNGIPILYQEFHHPIYQQLYDPFIPCLSVVDLLFNYGDKSLDVIRGIGVETIEHLFQ